VRLANTPLGLFWQLFKEKNGFLSNKALKNKEKIFSKNKSFFANCQKS
jgi:hypothetical protein